MLELRKKFSPFPVHRGMSLTNYTGQNYGQKLVFPYLDSFGPKGISNLSISNFQLILIQNMVELLTCRHLANLQLKHALRHAQHDAFNFHSHYIQSQQHPWDRTNQRLLRQFQTRGRCPQLYASPVKHNTEQITGEDPRYNAMMARSRWLGLPEPLDFNTMHSGAKDLRRDPSELVVELSGASKMGFRAPYYSAYAYIQSFGLADAYTYFLLVLSHYRFPTSPTYLSHYLSLLTSEHSLQTLRHGTIPLDIPAFKGYLKKNMTSERIGLFKVNMHAFSKSMREADQELFSGQRIEMKPSYRAQQRYMVNPAVFRKQDNGGGMREAMREEYLEEIRKEYLNREDRHRVGL